MFLHISDDNIFLDYAIEQFESIAPNRSKYIIITTGANNIKNIDKIKAVEYDSEIYHQYIKNLEKYEAVILHALTDYKIDIVNHASKNVKFVWMFWGSDGYQLPRMQKWLYTKKTKELLEFPKKRFVKKIFLIIQLIFYPIYRKYHTTKTGKEPFSGDLKKAIKRINFIAPVVEEDYYRLKKTIRIKAKLLPFSYGYIENIIDNNVKEIVYSNNILVGNSANPSNNHIDIFEKLNKLELSNIQIVTPLSYGNTMNYIAKISEIAIRYFGNNFKPIYDFLPLKEYNSLVDSCNFIILNQLRQQAGGLLLISLWKGKKVFMNKKSTLYHFYKKRKTIIFTTDDINEYTISKSLSKEEIEFNRKILLKHFSKEKVLEKTKSFIYIIEK